jgi:hypothetical protein
VTTLFFVFISRVNTEKEMRPAITNLVTSMTKLLKKVEEKTQILDLINALPDLFRRPPRAREPQYERKQPSSDGAASFMKAFQAMVSPTKERTPQETFFDMLEQKSKPSSSPACSYCQKKGTTPSLASCSLLST